MSTPLAHLRMTSAVVAAVIATALLGAAVTASATPRAQVVAAAAVAPDDDHIDHVLAISIDGLNPDALRQLDAGGAPNFHRLMVEGASTLNARTELESTSTLPNHTGMFTSVRVNERRGGHGVDFNDDDDRTTVHRAAGRYVPSVFDAAHDRGMSTALYTSKDKFALYNRSWNRRNGAADMAGRDNGRDKIDTFTYREDEDLLVDDVLADLADGAPQLTFLHLSSTDKVGHADGYMSPSYVSQVRTVDARLGRLLALVDATPELQTHLAVVLTSDHGGLGKSHGAAKLPVNYTIPFMVWGSGVPADADLYAMSSTYGDPGATRPSYTVEPRPIRNAMLGNLAADLLDLRRLPGSQMNNEFDLVVLSD